MDRLREPLVDYLREIAAIWLGMLSLSISCNPGDSRGARTGLMHIVNYNQSTSSVRKRLSPIERYRIRSSSKFMMFHCQWPVDVSSWGQRCDRSYA